MRLRLTLAWYKPLSFSRGNYEIKNTRIPKQEGLYQNMVNSCLVSTCNCKMVYSRTECMRNGSFSVLIRSAVCTYTAQNLLSFWSVWGMALFVLAQNNGLWGLKGVLSNRLFSEKLQITSIISKRTKNGSTLVILYGKISDLWGLLKNNDQARSPRLSFEGRGAIAITWFNVPFDRFRISRSLLWPLKWNSRLLLVIKSIENEQIKRA